MLLSALCQITNKTMGSVLLLLQLGKGQICQVKGKICQVTYEKLLCNSLLSVIMTWLSFISEVFFFILFAWD